MTQQRLPFDPLPFDDEADRPIPFELTARARRSVAPDALPTLHVVDGDVGADDPADTRPARARALLRAGADAETIAAQLGVDELLARAWVGDVAPNVRRRIHKQEPATNASDVGAPPARDVRWDKRRAAARDEARSWIDERDAQAALALGILAAGTTVDAHGVTYTGGDAALAARILALVHERAGADPHRVIIVVRIGPRVAGDLVRHQWAKDLGVELDAIAIARWRLAPAPDAVEAMIRIADPAVDAIVAGWLDVVRERSGSDLVAVDVAN